jgi:arachidonate 15-lipoxygenase
VWTVHAAADPADLAADVAALEERWRATRAFEIVSRIDGRAFDTYDPAYEPADPRATDREHRSDTVHFGYRDSISQPRFAVDLDGTGPVELVGAADDQPLAPIGAVLLGSDRPTSFEDVDWQQPTVAVDGGVYEIGRNGCFNAFRVLEQDVVGFEGFLHRAADDINAQLSERWRHQPPPAHPQHEGHIVWDAERVAAKLMGRWRNGVPLSLSSGTSGRRSAIHLGPGQPEHMATWRLNDFDYPDADHRFDDEDGMMCPAGAHIRRGNPRGSRMVQRSANATRLIVRRGVPYGPPYDPTVEPPRDRWTAGFPGPDEPPSPERGLIGNFLCSSIGAQFEAIMYDWINIGLQDPRITGTDDPIIGASTDGTFSIPIPGQDPIVLRHVPKLTTTRASAYLFVPSISAIRYLADGTLPATLVPPRRRRLAGPVTPLVPASPGGATSGRSNGGRRRPAWLTSLRWRLRRGFWDRLAVVKFRGQTPAVIPVPTAGPPVRLVPFSTGHPEIPIVGPLIAETPPADEVDRKKVLFTRVQHRLLRSYAPAVAGLPSIDDDPERALSSAYTARHRDCFPAPVRPAERTLGELAVASPYAGLLERLDDDRFVWDLSTYRGRPVHPGLVELGAVVEFRRGPGTVRLDATRIDTALGTATPGTVAWRRAERLAMCTVTTHTAMIRHFNWLHLTAGPVLEAATRNRLPVHHPVRRLLWWHVYGTHAGNELVTEVLMSPGGEFDAIFSLTHRAKCELFEATRHDFDLSFANPRVAAAVRRVDDAGLAMPAHEQWTGLYDVVHRHVARVLERAYPHADAIVGDHELGTFLDDLDELLPHGLTALTGGHRDLGSIATVLATVVHLATVEHEITGSGLWDYQLWNDVSPVRVHRDGSEAPLDVYQRLVNANFNLNVHRTMLLDDALPGMALDAPMVEAFVAFQQDLLAVQATLDLLPPAPWRMEPRRLKANINA